MEGPRIILDHWKEIFPSALISLGVWFNAKTGEEGLLISLNFPHEKSFRFVVSPSEVRRLKGIRNMDWIWTKQIRKELGL